jgi:hypothetical protein
MAVSAAAGSGQRAEAAVRGEDDGAGDDVTGVDAPGVDVRCAADVDGCGPPVVTRGA